MSKIEFEAPYAFMGEQYEIENSKVGIIPVPYGGTVTYKKGTDNGPNAIIEASGQLEFYDIELEKEPAAELGIHTFDAVKIAESPEKTIDKIEMEVENTLGKNLFPVVLGGEHTVALGAIKAIVKQHSDLSVLQIDAHSDLRETYQGSRYNHACVMKRVREYVKNIVSVGIRSMCKEEAKYIKNEKLEDSIHYGAHFNINKILSKLSDNVYITFDLDGLDPSEMPAIGTPEPGGLKYLQVLELLKTVAQKKKIVGFDVNELCPISGQHASDFLAAKLTYKLIGYSFFHSK